MPTIISVCECKHSIYIVQFPTPPPQGVEECTYNAVTANSGPQSDAQVFCGVAVSDAAGVEAE